MRRDHIDEFSSFIEVFVVRFGRIAVNQRQLSIGVGMVKPIPMQRDGLNDGKPLLLPVIQIALRLLDRRMIEESLCRVAKPEKRRSVLLHQIMPVIRNSQVR
jgi:hypothetical protein